MVKPQLKEVLVLLSLKARKRRRRLAVARVATLELNGLAANENTDLLIKVAISIVDLIVGQLVAALAHNKMS